MSGPKSLIALLIFGGSDPSGGHCLFPNHPLPKDPKPHVKWRGAIDVPWGRIAIKLMRDQLYIAAPFADLADAIRTQLSRSAVRHSTFIEKADISLGKIKSLCIVCHAASRPGNHHICQSVHALVLSTLYSSTTFFRGGLTTSTSAFWSGRSRSHRELQNRRADRLIDDDLQFRNRWLRHACAVAPVNGIFHS